MSGPDLSSLDFTELLSLADFIGTANAYSEDVVQLRNYTAARARVKSFYKERHEKHTVEFNIDVRAKFDTRKPIQMSAWDAIELLDSLTDRSNPNTESSQLECLMQTAEAIRKDGLPEWIQAVGFIHGLGKIMAYFHSEGNWDVLGNTFVIGCQFPKSIIYSETLHDNPDFGNTVYSTKYGIYAPHCGLDNVMLSWGENEYLFRVLKGQCSLPYVGLAMIRYNSFHPWHTGGDYEYLMNEQDFKTREAVQLFNPYEVYRKREGRCDVDKLKPYYQRLISKFFPNKINW